MALDHSFVFRLWIVKYQLSVSGRREDRFFPLTYYFGLGHWEAGAHKHYNNQQNSYTVSSFS